MSHSAFEKLFSNGSLWRGRGESQLAGQVRPTGWKALDECTGGGWPRAGLVELLSTEGLGLPLLLPMLAQASQARGWLAWVAPPHVPFAPALLQAGVDLKQVLLVNEVDASQRLWAAEQLLGSGHCSVVMLWPRRLQTAQIRRLQLAAEQGDCLGVMFRPLREMAQSSPVGLRLKVSASLIGLDVQVLKRRAGWAGQGCSVRLAP